MVLTTSQGNRQAAVLPGTWRGLNPEPRGQKTDLLTNCATTALSSAEAYGNGKKQILKTAEIFLEPLPTNVKKTDENGEARLESINLYDSLSGADQ